MELLEIALQELNMVRAMWDNRKTCVPIDDEISTKLLVVRGYIKEYISDIKFNERVQAEVEKRLAYAAKNS